MDDFEPQPDVDAHAGALMALRMRLRERAEEADAREREQISARRNEGSAALERFRAEQDAAREVRASANQEHDKQLMEQLEAGRSASNPWVSVSTMVDVSAEAAGSRDTALMRKLLLHLKAEPVLTFTERAAAAASGGGAGAGVLA